jgi:hypothetical protein
MAVIDYTSFNVTSAFKSYSSGTIDARSSEQKKKDLITRLLKDDKITLDEALVLLEKGPEPPFITGTSTSTNITAYPPHTSFTLTKSVEKELIN